ncbi:MAG: hypothetical protein JW913_18760 [Chitinispirillaceae bacterium]|nr:hypothetical protein [Chitinispirillaceae bacterium]
MRRKSLQHKCTFGCREVVCALLSVAMQCALSGSIVDRGRFETKMTAMRLENREALKVYHGGSKRDIPLKLVNTIIIDPSNTITIDNELYFSADITLKDGTRIKSLEKDQTASTKVFLSVQDALVGKNDDGRFVIGLEDVSRLTVR